MTTHTITLARHTAQVVGLMGVLVLGTWDSYGTEQLLLRHGPEWEGLAIDATFHNVPNGEGVTVLADTDGLVTVPPEACMRASKYATITIRGVQDGVQRISCNLPYMVLDHAQVPGANSTATPSENAQALTQMQDLRDSAVDAKNQAEAARDGAADSATAAAASEKAAASSAVAAAGSAAQAEAQKTAAAKSASDAQGYMQTASGAATAANASAENAAASADKANAGETAAAASASNAVASASNAAASASNAAASASNAAASAASAENAASDAQGYMQTASDAATAANASAENAEGSKAAAANSATAAAGSATAAAGDAKIASDAAAGATDAKAAAVAAQKDAAASKVAAANSSAAAKTSEDAAAKSAADADSTANSINESMTQIAALQKRQNVLVGSETGNPIDVDDAFAAPLCGLTVYGRSTQDGTPTPDAPVPIVSAGDSGSVAVKVTGKNLFYEQEFQEYFINSVANTVGLATGNVSCVLQVVTGAKYYVTRSKIGAKFRVAVVDKLPTLGNPVTPSSGINADSKRQIEISATSKYMVIQCEDEAAFSELMVSLDSSTAYSPYREQLLTLPTPNGLPGIPVTSGGNYTDENGQQWICDEVDLERGVKVQRVNAVDLSTCVITGTTKFAATKRLAIRLPLNGRDYKTEALCNKLQFLVSFTKDTLHFYVDVSSAQVFIPIGAKNPEEGEYILFYALATPIETPLTPAEIAAYKALTAYAPDTVVQASDGAGIKLDYQRDVNIVIKKFEDAIASMTTT